MWYETLNGFDVWPDPAKPKPPEPVAWDLAQRADFIAHRMRVARERGNDARADQLKRWHDRMIARLAAQHHGDR